MVVPPSGADKNVKIMENYHSNNKTVFFPMWKSMPQ
jgi:hypothetical protein